MHCATCITKLGLKIAVKSACASAPSPEVGDPSPVSHPAKNPSQDRAVLPSPTGPRAPRGRARTSLRAPCAPPGCRTRRGGLGVGVGWGGGRRAAAVSIPFRITIYKAVYISG